MLKDTLVNLFVAPLAIRVARALAKSRGAKDFFHQGVAVYCSEERAPLIKDALDEVVRFFGDDWPRYRRNLKRIIVDPEIQSALWFSVRSLLVKEDKAMHAASAEHFAGFLVANYERIQCMRRKGALYVIWSSSLASTALECGKQRREAYFSGKK